VELRMAQLAIMRGSSVVAYVRTRDLAAGSDAAAEQARVLMALHRDLLAEGASQMEQED